MQKRGLSWLFSSLGPSPPPPPLSLSLSLSLSRSLSRPAAWEDGRLDAATNKSFLHLGGRAIPFH